MKIKEFSNKNSLALFYSTITLLILAIILFFTLAYEGGKTRKKLDKNDFKIKEEQMLNKESSVKNKTSAIERSIREGAVSTITVEVKP